MFYQFFLRFVKLTAKNCYQLGIYQQKLNFKTKDNMENKTSITDESKTLQQADVRRGFITSFKDKYGNQIKEGDIIREVIFQDKEKYHYEERFDMMGNEKVARIVDERFKLNGWCLRQIKWSKDCLIAERIKDSETISTSRFDYLNEAFMGVNSTKDIEIIGSIYDGWVLGNYA